MHRSAQHSAVPYDAQCLARTFVDFDLAVRPTYLNVTVLHCVRDPVKSKLPLPADARESRRTGCMRSHVTPSVIMGIAFIERIDDDDDCIVAVPVIGAEAARQR